MIRSAGFTEARYAAEQRRTALRRELADTVSGGLSAPKSLADAVNRYQNEQRTVDFVALDRAQAGDLTAPTPEVLAKYYDEHKAQFRAPEYRKVSTLMVSPQDLAATLEIPDADVRRYYEEHRAQYAGETPDRADRIFERRRCPSRRGSRRQGREFRGSGGGARIETARRRSRTRC